MKDVIPFLWFHDQVQEAVELYVQTIKNSKIIEIHEINHHIQSITFSLDEQVFIAFQGGDAFTLTPAYSMMVLCDDQAEIDYYWEVLSKEGKEMRCGWLEDRFGLVWQIVPKGLQALLENPNVLEVMLGMSKLDLEVLKAANDEQPLEE